MTEREFKEKVAALLAERAADKILALDLGRRFRELCAEYAQNNSELPKGFEGLG